jgi:hypothetical protein
MDALTFADMTIGPTGQPIIRGERMGEIRATTHPMIRYTVPIARTQPADRQWLSTSASLSARGGRPCSPTAGFWLVPLRWC